MLNTRIRIVAALAFGLVALGSQSVAQNRSSAETGMAGVKLFDSALKLLDKYGHPDEMVSLGGGGGGGAGAGAGAAAAPGRRAGTGAPARGGRGQAGAGAANPADFRPDEEVIPLSESLMFFQGSGGAGGGGGQGGGSSDDGAATPSVGGPPRYMRWTYRRSPSRYTFIIDKNLRIVQIEAICGAYDPGVKTSKGIKFGSTFEDVLRKYGNPDAFEINGDTIVMRYLVNNKVAFRLNRIQKGKPHVVVGMVVAAGKG